VIPVTAAQLTALISGLAALATAIGGVVALFKHTSGPAHKP
jgi:hypothetical protein